MCSFFQKKNYFTFRNPFRVSFHRGGPTGTSSARKISSKEFCLSDLIGFFSGFTEFYGVWPGFIGFDQVFFSNRV